MEMLSQQLNASVILVKLPKLPCIQLAPTCIPASKSERTCPSILHQNRPASSFLFWISTSSEKSVPSQYDFTGHFSSYDEFT